MERRCTLCKDNKPMPVFGQHPSHCKGCRTRRHRELWPKIEDSLYVMGCEIDPDGERLGWAIGRTCNSSRRIIDHQRGLPFRMAYMQLFLQCGPLEQAVHRRLAAFRNTEGLGREWFRLPLADCLAACESEIRNAKLSGLLQTSPGGDPPGDAESPGLSEFSTGASTA
jgi:hypothetical protein